MFVNRSVFWRRRSRQQAYPLNAKTGAGSIVNGTINGNINGNINGHINDNPNDNISGNGNGSARNGHKTVNTRRDIERAEAELRHSFDAQMKFLNEARGRLCPVSHC